MSKFVDFYLIGELVDSHGHVNYDDLKNLPTVNEYEIVKNYCKSRCLTMIDTSFLKEIFNLNHGERREDDKE